MIKMINDHDFIYQIIPYLSKFHSYQISSHIIIHVYIHDYLYGYEWLWSMVMINGFVTYVISEVIIML